LTPKSVLSNSFNSFCAHTIFCPWKLYFVLLFMLRSYLKIIIMCSVFDLFFYNLNFFLKTDAKFINLIIRTQLSLYLSYFRLKIFSYC